MIEVAAAIVEDDEGRILIARRREGKSQAGLWEFPGGKLEPGETAEDCIVRELREELNIVVRPDEPFGTNDYAYDAGTIRLIAYRATYIDGSIRLVDHDRYEWVMPQQFERYRFAPADVLFCREAERGSQKLKFANSTIADVSADALWQEWADVPSWPNWDEELAEALLEGPFAMGTFGRMKSRKGAWSKFQIVNVDRTKGYSCIVPLPGAQLKFNRTFERLDVGVLRITHELDFTGAMGWAYALLIGRPTNRAYPEMLRTFIRLVRAREARG